MESTPSKPVAPRLSLWFEIACWMVAVATLGFVAVHALKAESTLRTADHLAEFRQASRPANPVETTMLPGKLLGRMDIPAIHLSVPLLEGDDASVLRHAVGHIPGTAAPGGLGNVGVAGHRDTLLRPLQAIKPQMVVSMTTRAGTFSYLVDSVEVVTPAKVEVLDIGDVPQLTIVTCYPFHFIGSAPDRFIVHAHLVSLTPTS